MSKKSTNVRFPPVPAWLAAVMPPIARVAPGIAGSVALRLFETPPRARAARPSDLLERHVLTTEDGQLVTYSAGRGPTVLLVHGWGGRATQFGALVEPLVRAGFGVVTFDGPAHGDTAGRRTALPAFARALDALTERHGPPAGVIAHSFGCAVVAYQLAERWPACPAVFIAPMAQPRVHFDNFLRALGFAESLRHEMFPRAERRYGVPWHAVDAIARAPRNRGPLLVVHDADDARIPVAEGTALAAAWPRARLKRTSGLGHNRVLGAREVVEAAVAFLAEHRDQTVVRAGAAS